MWRRVILKQVYTVSVQEVLESSRKLESSHCEIWKGNLKKTMQKKACLQRTFMYLQFCSLLCSVLSVFANETLLICVSGMLCHTSYFHFSQIILITAVTTAYNIKRKIIRRHSCVLFHGAAKQTTSTAQYMWAVPINIHVLHFYHFPSLKFLNGTLLSLVLLNLFYFWYHPIIHIPLCNDVPTMCTNDIRHCKLKRKITVTRDMMSLCIMNNILIASFRILLYTSCASVQVYITFVLLNHIHFSATIYLTNIRSLL